MKDQDHKIISKEEDKKSVQSEGLGIPCAQLGITVKLPRAVPGFGEVSYWNTIREREIPRGESIPE